MCSSNNVHFKLPQPLTATPLILTAQPKTLTVRASSSVSTSFYDVLGISSKGSLGEVKKAYKHMARKYHPDVSPKGRVEEYKEIFIRVQEAYETLSDPKRRAVYDADVVKGVGLAFSTQRRCNDDKEMEYRNEWKNRWQIQLSELKIRSMYKDPRRNMSWGMEIKRKGK